MSPLWPILKRLLAAAPGAMSRGALLSVIVLLMGAALLGVSGWFITAIGLAGMAGIGIAFDVFAPSAGVRFLAIGRTAARYGERVLTHDATLKALAALRVDLLRAQAAAGGRALERLRGEAALTRIIADVDALDGLVLRLALPALAGLVTHLAVFLMLLWLVGLPVALAIAVGMLPLTALVLWRLGRVSRGPSDAAEAGAQALRRGLIDMIRDRTALFLAGQLPAREAELAGLDATARAAAAALDRAERRAGFGLSVVATLSVALALLAGGWLVAQGMDAARAGIGIFVAMALMETILPLRRGVAEIGRMIGAAGRISLAHPAAGAGGTEAAGAPLLRLAEPALTLSPGMAVALRGPSGSGKTTLLMQIAGLEPGQGIEVMGRAPLDWNETALRDVLAMVPQRSRLMAGTVRENLALAGPAGDAAMLEALEAVDLTAALLPRGGLDLMLGEGGAGLSGGQAKRLCLARALLRRPRILLLDEPTEGLDSATAARVMAGLRQMLPDTAILAAMHTKKVDHEFVRTVKLDM